MIRALLLLSVGTACGDNQTPNRPPTSEAFSLTTQEDLPVTRTVDAADLDNDELEVAIPIPPDHGEVTFTGLSITYTPDADYHGADQFAVVVGDGDAEAEVLTVEVTVTAVNDPPIGVTDSRQTTENTPLTVTIAQLIANDSDADVATDGQILTITAVDSATNGAVVLAGSNITFTPAANFQGGASFVYTLSDGIEASPVMVTVVVGP